MQLVWIWWNETITFLWLPILALRNLNENYAGKIHFLDSILVTCIKYKLLQGNTFEHTEGTKFSKVLENSWGKIPITLNSNFFVITKISAKEATDNLWKVEGGVWLDYFFFQSNLAEQERENFGFFECSS